MKRYDGIMIFGALTYLVMAMLLALVWHNGDTREDTGYKVEINRIMRSMEAAGGFTEPDLQNDSCVRMVSFLPASMEESRSVREFYGNHNGVHTMVLPLYEGEELLGYVRFDYVMMTDSVNNLWLAEGMLFLVWLLQEASLWYVRQKIIRPFHVISQIPNELSKGHLQIEIQESKSRFFGKFVWSLSMLRDALRESKNKAFKLEKEKKLMLLSLSHDIKIPLSAIKLYAKAIQEGVYETGERQADAAEKIEKHAGEIETFVGEIMNAASEDILEIEIVDSEFYLKEYVEKIRECYAQKCRLVMTELAIGDYEDKLLRGDMDRAFEAMENLLENAMKYGDGRQIKLTFYEEEYCQVVEVYNTGSVVSREELPHLFDSFYRGSNAKNRAGNGLGLYIDRQIMLKMGGDIFARRTPDGMCFGLVFACE